MIRDANDHCFTVASMENFDTVSYTHLDVYKRQALSDPYKAADETYYNILVPEKNSKGKGFRKGYLWVVVGISTRMIYLLYDDGSRSERVILNELGSCKGIIQSDGYSSASRNFLPCLASFA